MIVNRFSNIKYIATQCGREKLKSFLGFVILSTVNILQFICCTGANTRDRNLALNTAIYYSIAIYISLNSRFHYFNFEIIFKDR